MDGEGPELRRSIGAAVVVPAVVVAANALTLLSVFVERSGPELEAYGNLCGPTTSDPCLQPVLKGGFPFAFLIDRPGVSVEHQLGLAEDRFQPGTFALDAALYCFAMLFVVVSIRSWTARR